MKHSRNKFKIKSNLAKTVEEIGDKARYDTEVKKVLSDPQILAWILKHTITEFRDSSIPEIIRSIQGKPEVGIHPLRPGHYTAPLEGMSTESTELLSQRVTYDVRFEVIIPGTGHTKMILNLEAQNSFHEGYDLITRGIFYCARMISSQVRNEESAKEYRNIKKVVSIWICLNVPLHSEYTTTDFHINRRDLYGHMKSKVNNRYDLMELVLVCLGRPEHAGKGTRLHQLLNTVLSDKLSPDKKKEIMRKDFNIITSVELEGGLAKMCNLSDGIEERGWQMGLEEGISQGLSQGLSQGINQGKLSVLFSLVAQNIISLQKAAEEAGLPLEKFEELYYKENI